MKKMTAEHFEAIFRESVLKILKYKFIEHQKENNPKTLAELIKNMSENTSTILTLPPDTKISDLTVEQAITLAFMVFRYNNL